MKYTKKFQTESDYQAFKNSNNWITPNVSVIEEASDSEVIKYNPFLFLLSFIINNPYGTHTNFQAEEGMMWEEWVKSSYNLDGYVISDGKVMDTWSGNYVSLNNEMVGENDFIYETTYGMA